LWTQTCEYALRAATYIAQHDDNGSVLARDVSEAMDVPHQYLQKVLRELVRNGILTSTRGIGGGFRLKRPARRIRLIELIAPFDDFLQRTTCPFGNPRCGKANPCPVHDRWTTVVDAYRTFLESTTLGDLLPVRVDTRRRR
jgi:Rrf2 family iron-sulfur cluster assembly transcriptional regulator